MPIAPDASALPVHPLLNIAIRAAREAGRVIVRDIDRVDTLDVSVKGRNDFVSEVDRRAEHAIISTIRRSYPDHAVLGEESGADGESDHVWVIDPLDGTTNYLHGFPVFCVSIAIKYRGKIEHGVVYDPLRNELFTATRGRGAQLNDRRIRVSRRPGLEGALLGTGFPYRDLSQLDEYLAVFRELITRTAGIRRPGSAALDLAYVAAGRMDGFWECGLKEWDVAAGTLLIQEAGGTVTDFQGGETYLATGDIVGGGLRVHGAILDVVRRHAARPSVVADAGAESVLSGSASPATEDNPDSEGSPGSDGSSGPEGSPGSEGSSESGHSPGPEDHPGTGEPPARAVGTLGIAAGVASGTTPSIAAGTAAEQPTPRKRPRILHKPAREGSKPRGS